MVTLKWKAILECIFEGSFLHMDSLESIEKKAYLCVEGVTGIAQKDRLCGRTVYSLGLTKGPLTLLRVEDTKRGQKGSVKRRKKY